MPGSKHRKDPEGDGASRSPLRDLISVIALALAVAAIVKELRTKPDQRTWHGAIAGVVPYDFRAPTLARLKERVWNPEGPLLSRQVFGVGWTINAGAVVAKVRSMLASASP